MCNLLCLHRSPSQIRDTFYTFPHNLKLILDTLTNSNPFVIASVGDFNAKTTKWYKNDRTSYETSTIDVIISQFDLQQLINEPTLPRALINFLYLSQILLWNKVFILLLIQIAIIR